MNFLRKIWNIVTEPFISVAVMIDESRRINEDGSWDEYNRKRNECMMRREERKNRRNHD